MMSEEEKQRFAEVLAEIIGIAMREAQRTGGGWGYSIALLSTASLSLLRLVGHRLDFSQHAELAQFSNDTSRKLVESGGLKIETFQ
jgi:hypothetical protein